MKSTARLALAALVLATCTGCRGIQINQLEQRIDALESRVSVLEATTAVHGK